MALDYIEHLTVRSSKQFFHCEACMAESTIRVDERPGRRT
jgi:hypothetical protein